MSDRTMTACPSCGAFGWLFPCSECGYRPEQGDAMRPGPMNIEARALAETILAQPRYIYGPDLDEDRDLAAEARHGGRALTKELARFAGPEVSRQMMAERPAKAWHYHIDPSGSYDWRDERRGAESRASWQRIARYGTEGKDLDWGRTLPYLTGSLTIEQAEAMVDWPIFRAAHARQTFDALWGQSSDSEEEVLTTLAHCAGIPGI